MKLFAPIFALACLSLAPVSFVRAENDVPEPETPQVAPASDEGKNAMSGFQIPEGFKVELFAAEPRIANPVAFCFDPTGRVFVAETFRQGKGVEDNRGHNYWLNDDLAAQSVEDRRAYILKHHPEAKDDYTKYDDRIRLIEDRDGDHKADHDSVFADHFNDVVEGTGAGVIWLDGDLFYTNIPNLWKLRDTDNDGVADVRKALHTGYGVRFAFRGHDMHGLAIGNDGKIYYSIGDRGYNIRSNGGVLKDPASGAVFRCNPDGSELEVFYTGLRNPQELAFDDYGNLFTGDNNSDSGDQARWVYLVEGGNSGWNMAYQYLSDRGPWNREKLWHPFHEGQAAYLNPPIRNFADGPSGLAYYPGVGLGEKYRGTFFLCDFRGGPANSGVRSFKMKPNGATYEMVDDAQPIWRVLATDVDFGPDGAIYVSDWVDGWNGLNKGRLYRFFDPQEIDQPVVKEMQQLLAAGFSDKANDELAKLLAHPDRRVRQGAQFELAKREQLEVFNQVATSSDNQLARLHAIWGVGQIVDQLRDVRERVEPTKVLSGTLVKDADPEVRAQAAKVLGDLEVPESLVALLNDENPRVKYFALVGVGKGTHFGDTRPMFNRIVEILAENDDQDPVLRHGAVLALTGTRNVQQIGELSKHDSVAVRRAAVVALRRLQSPTIVRFLGDGNELVTLEAARAIHDLPIEAAMPQLAGLIDRGLKDDALLRRVLNANFRIGDAETAAALAQYAAKSSSPEAMRLEALAMLEDWAEPKPTDRVLNFYRPLEKRDPEVAKAALVTQLPGLLAGPEKVRNAAAKLAAKFGIQEVAPVLIALIGDAQQSPQTRADALTAAVALDGGNKQAVLDAMSSDVPEVRAAARSLLLKVAPEEAIAKLAAGAKADTVVERQQALASLAETNLDGAAAAIADRLNALLAGEVPVDTQLDVVQAGEAKRDVKEVGDLLAKYEASLDASDPLTFYRSALAGGDAEKGRKIFFEKTEVSCVRCHRAEGVGGRVGPELDKIGAEKEAEYLLEAVVRPNAKIAKGFESVMVLTVDGQTLSGVLKEENDDTLSLVNAEGNLLTISQDDIDVRKAANSPMPEDIYKHLSRQEVRDLVAFLASLKGASGGAGHE